MENICFVLGGIALTEKFDFDELLKYVGARQIPVDAKFKFFSYGNSDLKKSLQQSRLRKFFEYLLHKKILIHFDSSDEITLIDYLTPSRIIAGVKSDSHLKNELKEICKKRNIIYEGLEIDPLNYKLRLKKQSKSE